MSNNRELQDNHLKSLSDMDLMLALDMAYEDTKKASIDEKESEWHQSCFAALFLYADEIKRRGLTEINQRRKTGLHQRGKKLDGELK